MTANQWRATLLACGAGAGFLLAIWGIFSPGPGHLPDYAAAKVGDIVIHRDAVAELTQLIASGKSVPLSDRERGRILESMIDERLLIARGLELGLIESDPLVRKSIANAMLQAAMADVRGVAPKEEDLEKFFRKEQDYFTRAERLHVQTMHFFDDLSGGSREQALERAKRAKIELDEGRPFDEIASSLSDPQTLRTPDTLLPKHKLRQYIGPTLLREASQLSPGEVGGPVRSQGGYALIRLVNARRDGLPEFAEMRPVVLQEYKRRREQQAVSDYLRKLRGETRIVIAEDMSGLVE